MHNPVRPVIVEDANAQLAGRVFNKTLPGLAGTSGAAGANGNSTLVYQDGTAPAGNTVTNTTVETAITSTYSFGANTLKVGSTIRVRLFGLYSTALIAPSLTLKLKLGATTVLSSGALALVAGITAAGWSAEALLIVTAIGAGGTIECQGYAEFATAATTALSANITNTAVVSLDTTVSQALTVTLQWSAASASNTITVRQMVVELEEVGVAAAGGGGSNSGRLTLTSGVPVTTADVTGATTVYWTPYKGNQIQLWNGSAWATNTFIETGLAVSAAAANIVFDRFAYLNAGVLALEDLAWKNATITMTIASPCVVTWTAHGFANGDPVTFSNAGGALPTGIVAGTMYYTAFVTANTFQLITQLGVAVNTSGSQSGTHTGWSGRYRGTAVTLQDGRYCKSGDKTRLYLGTYCTTGTTTTEDSGGGVTTQVGGKRYVWNYYNRVNRFFSVFDSAAFYSYGTNAWRQQNGAGGNKVEVVRGFDEDAVEFTHAECMLPLSTTTVSQQISIGINTVLVPIKNTSGYFNQAAAVSVELTVNVAYRGLPGIGHHAINCLEKGGGGGSSRFGIDVSGQPVSQGSTLA